MFFVLFIRNEAKYVYFHVQNVCRLHQNFFCMSAESFDLNHPWSAKFYVFPIMYLKINIKQSFSFSDSVLDFFCKIAAPPSKLFLYVS